MRNNMSLVLPALAIGFFAGAVCADSNIDENHKYAWGENIGWTNWRDANGAVDGVNVGQTFLGGYIWAENVGYINVGDGSPAGGTYYANVDSSDFGVNVDPTTGYLFGYAWGENIGWINFNTMPYVGTQGARYDAANHRFHGYAWGENIGWINLDDATHYVAVQPATCAGDLDGDGDTDQSDLGILLAAYGISAAGDLDNDGDTDQSDLGILLADYGCVP
ncbi:MAG: hypothetical protein KAS72_14830 [Phycisphaerales bacterium]|nr:hypothetical protein [Phycisphaerales bacterium]